MSMAASAWAKRQDAKTPGAKLVLMIVADYATYTEFQEPVQSEGRHYAWPGVGTIANDCHMSERTVIKHLGDLEALDLIRREQRRAEGGRRTTDFLILPVDDAGDRMWETDQSGAYLGQVQNLHVKDSPTSGEDSAPASYIGTTKEPPTPSARAGKRKLPIDFEVTAEMRDWYRQTIGGSIDGQAEHAKFVDYWHGTGKTMADWPATWRNWMRRAMERSGNPRQPGAVRTPASRPRFPTAQERNQMQRDDFQGLALAAEKWVEEHGGNPDDHKQVLAVMERMKAERAKGDASRTPGTYSEGGGYINGEIVTPKEVTAGEGQ